MALVFPFPVPIAVPYAPEIVVPVQPHSAPEDWFEGAAIKPHPFPSM